MPSVTYDGRSFMLDGRRLWIAGGAIHYSRIPRELWAERILAAKHAGLNTIETPVFWARHEPRPKHFDFTEGNDLRHFVQLIGKAGLHCILRPGPFVGGEWDNGGLPPWVLSLPGVRLRTNSGPFLEAASRFLTAVAEQVRDLQVTSPGKAGPVLLIQSESQWTCGSDALAHSYLGELDRYIREAGLNVPVINSNNLYQSLEGEIDCWTGSARMLSTMRQLAAVRPDRPRLVVEFPLGRPLAWGRPAPDSLDPDTVQRSLAQILAGGGQFNITPFFAGTNFGFSAGRSPDAREGFFAASRDPHAPILESGARGPLWSAVRRVATFASRFSRVLANLDPAFQPVVADPSALGAGLSVTHATGAQGGVSFIFNDDPSDAGRATTLLLPDGTSLPMPLAGMPVVWCLFGANLSGRATLDYSNLSAFAAVGKLFVCFGNPGAPGRLSINGSPLSITVPEGDSPAIVEHEGVTVIVCSAAQLDSTFITDDAVFLNVAGLTADNQPVLAPGAKTCTRLNAADGASKHLHPTPPPARRNSSKIALEDWHAAPMRDYAEGKSARFASITGPADLAELGSPYGYGWYRLKLKSSGGKTLIAFPHAADRLHASLDGHHLGIAGVGPGAAETLSLPLAKGTSTLVLLAENLGRVAGGPSLGEKKGLFGHAWEVRPLRVAKPSIKSGDPVDILKFQAPLWNIHTGDATEPDRLTWNLPRKGPLFITIRAASWRGLVLVNDKPVRFIDRGGRERLVLEKTELSRRTNSLQIALLDAETDDGSPAHLSSIAAEVAAGVTILEGLNCISLKADWAFAKWEAPRDGAFHPLGKHDIEKGTPAWYRASFNPGDNHAAIFLDAAGLTKGQLYVNGRHVSRYFVATASGKAVPPQTRYYIPGPWLKPDAENELLLFDEHGAPPTRARLVHD